MKIKAVTIAPNEIYTSGNDKMIKEWDIRTFQLLDSKLDQRIFTKLQYTRFNKLIASCSGTPVLQVRDLYEETKPIIWETNNVMEVSKSSDSAILVKNNHWRMYKCSEIRTRAKSARF